MSKYCFRCGHPMNDTAKFCGFCGAHCEPEAPVRRADGYPAVQTAQTVPQRATPYHDPGFDLLGGECGENPYAPRAAAPKPKSIKGLVIALSITAALIAACTALLIVLNPF